MSDEQSGPDMSTVLVVVLVVIPLIIAIVVFGRVALGWFDDAGATIKEENVETLDGTF